LPQQQANTGLQHLKNTFLNLRSGQTAHGNSLRPMVGPGSTAQGIDSSSKAMVLPRWPWTEIRRCGQALARLGSTDLPHIG
jgi:hypothetical protein